MNLNPELLTDIEMNEEVFLQNLVNLFVTQAKDVLDSYPKNPNSLTKDRARLPSVSGEAKGTAHFKRIDPPINILSKQSNAKPHKAESEYKFINPLQGSA